MMSNDLDANINRKNSNSIVTYVRWIHDSYMHALVYFSLYWQRCSLRCSFIIYLLGLIVLNVNPPEPALGSIS